MISFQQARRLIRSEAKVLPVEVVDVQDALGRVLAEQVNSAVDQPRFDNAAVDGYALRFEQGQKTYRLAGEVVAGEQFEEVLQRGDCIRIFSGAQIPTGADTCVMEEHVERYDTHIAHHDKDLTKGANIRSRGEDLNKGAMLMARGAQVNAQAIGLFSACGIQELRVVKIPYVHVIITGSAFTTPDIDERGKTFNSNGPMLQAALRSIGIECVLEQVNDDGSALKSAVENALRRADLIISTGGISEGDHDRIRTVCKSVHMRTVFHKVAQKPGKAMYFGKRDDSYFVGLSGDPRAAMIGFWMHVLPLLYAIQGVSHTRYALEELPLGKFFAVKGIYSQLLAVRIEKGQVFVIREQNSFVLQTLLNADGIAVITTTQASFNAGDLIQVFRLEK